MQYFVLDNSPESKSESGKRAVPGSPHVRNQAPLNDDTICVGNK